MTGRDPDHERIWESLPEYALGVLDADETAIVEAHLPGCPECRAELQSLRTITAGLALSLDPVDAPDGHQARFAQKLERLDPVATPPGHRDRFLQKLEAETGQPLPAVRRADEGGEGEVQAAPIPLTPPARPQLEVIRTPQPTLRSWGGWVAAGALAAALIPAILWGSSERADLMQTQATAVAAQTRVAAAEATAGANSQMAAVLASPASKAADLTGSGSLQATRARLWMDPVNGMMVLHAEDLPPAPTGQQYELWLLRGSTPVAVDLFQTPGTGAGTYLFTVPPGTPSDYTAAALTLEVRRETAPTSAPVLVGNF